MTRHILDRYEYSSATVSEYTEAYGSQEAALNALIDDARENRARLYCLPAYWYAVMNQDGSATVTRMRNK